MTPLFHSKNCGMNGNRAYLRDEKVDEMIDAASMETDREKRLQTYRDLQVRLNELCPWVPLYYKSNMVGRRADLKGFQFNKNTALHYLGDCYFEELVRTAASEKSGAAAIFYLSAKKRDISFKFPGAQTEFCYPVPVFTDNWGKLFKNPGSFVFSGNSYTMIYLLLSDDIFPGVFHKFNLKEMLSTHML